MGKRGSWVHLGVITILVCRVPPYLASIAPSPANNQMESVQYSRIPTSAIPWGSKPSNTGFRRYSHYSHSSYFTWLHLWLMAEGPRQWTQKSRSRNTWFPAQFSASFKSDSFDRVAYLWVKGSRLPDQPGNVRYHFKLLHLFQAGWSVCCNVPLHTCIWPSW